MESRCPTQKAFVKQLEDLMSTRDLVDFRYHDEKYTGYVTEYTHFVDRWCPTLNAEYFNNIEAAENASRDNETSIVEA